MNEREQEKDLFISYVEVDRSWAEWIAWQAEQAGYSVILQAWDFRPGDNHVRLVDEAIKRSHRVLLVLSPEYFSAKAAMSQWTAAFARGTVLPILVRECGPHIMGLLGSVLPLNLMGYHSEEQARELLLSGLGRERAKPSTSPVFPSTLLQRPDFPLPVIWNVPHQRNPFFLGRDAVFHVLRRDLVPGGRTTALTQAISGLGGIGKTQVAIEYAHRYAQDYEAVLWLQADSREILTAACLQLATEVFGLLEQPEAEKQVEAVKRWFQTHRGWLLILDNVEKPQEILSTIVPSKHQGSVLFTTRMRDAGPLAHSELLPLLSDEEGVLLLLRRAKRIALHASVEDAVAADVLLAKDLCQLMDGLPLALDQAGAYIAEIGCSLQRYIALYEQSRPKLLDRRGSGDHLDSVLMTFWLSWQQIQERNALAGRALQFCAFLAPDQISEQLVQAGIILSKAEKTLDEVEMDEALGLLYRYSLIERAGQSLSLHRLVQEVTQDLLSEEERQQWMQRAVLVVNAVFPSGEHGTWQQCEFLLPHALACVKWIKDLRQKKLEGAHLLSVTGRYLYERAQYSESEPLHQKALSIREQEMGLEHADVAASLNNLASLYRELGKYAEAEPLYQRALHIREQKMGAESLYTAQSLNDLAFLYVRQGNYTQAQPLYERALEIRERVLGPEHPDTAQNLNNLAFLHVRQGNYFEALPLNERALEIRERVLGPEHPDTAQSLNDLAFLHVRQGNYTQAQPLYERALEIRERVLGSEHPDTAQSLNNLAFFLVRQGNYSKVLPLHIRALEIRERVLGPEHPYTAQSLNNLAYFYERQGNYTDALPLHIRALEIRERVLGPEHPYTAQSLNNLAFLYVRQGNYAQAQRLYERALEIRERVLEPEHPDTAQTLNDLASLYERLGKYAQAHSLYGHALEIRERVLGPEHPYTAQSLNSLALLYVHQGNYTQAQRLYERALEIRERVLGSEHPDTAQTLNDLASLYVRQGNYTQAQRLYERALEIRECVLGSEHPYTAQSLNNLAYFYECQGNYTQAHSLYERALEIRERVLGSEHPDTAQSLNDLASLYERLGKYPEAVSLHIRALEIREHILGPEHPDTMQSQAGVKYNFTILSSLEEENDG